MLPAAPPAQRPGPGPVQTIVPWSPSSARAPGLCTYCRDSLGCKRRDCRRCRPGRSPHPAARLRVFYSGTDRKATCGFVCGRPDGPCSANWRGFRFEGVNRRICARGPGGPSKVKVSWSGLRRCWQRNTDGTGGKNRGRPLKLVSAACRGHVYYELFQRKVLAFLRRIGADFDECLLGCRAALSLLKDVRRYFTQ